MVDQTDKNVILNRWSIPRFWKTMICTTVLVVAISAILNLLVNPYGLYGVELVPRSDTNFYEKKLSLLDADEPKPQALIIGSSRTFAFNPDIVEEMTDRRCFNISVPGAKAEIFYAVLKMVLDEYNAPIDTLVLGVDPEAFHPVLPIQPEARYIDAISKYFVHDKSGQASITEKLGLLFTLDQTTESFDSIFRILKQGAGESKMEYRADGYAGWIQLDEEIANGEFNLQERLDSRIWKYADRSLYLDEFRSLSETRKQYWDDLIALCSERGIRLYVFLPPYHPELLRVLDDLGASSILNQVDDYLEETVNGDSGTYRNYLRIEDFGGSPDLFYDEIHMQPENCDILLRDLLTGDKSESDDDQLLLNTGNPS